jgi:hypothetical protein
MLFPKIATFLEQIHSLKFLRIQTVKELDIEHGGCWYSFRYGVNLHVLLMFFTLFNNSAKQQKLGTLPGILLRCLN